MLANALRVRRRRRPHRRASVRQASNQGQHGQHGAGTGLVASDPLQGCGQRTHLRGGQRVDLIDAQQDRSLRMRGGDGGGHKRIREAGRQITRAAAHAVRRDVHRELQLAMLQPEGRENGERLAGILADAGVQIVVHQLAMQLPQQRHDHVAVRAGFDIDHPATLSASRRQQFRQDRGLAHAPVARQQARLLVVAATDAPHRRLEVGELRLPSGQRRGDHPETGNEGLLMSAAGASEPWPPNSKLSERGRGRSRDA